MSIVTRNDILETINMIQHENLDVRTITMGISLYDCVSDDIINFAITFMIRLQQEQNTL